MDDNDIINSQRRVRTVVSLPVDDKEWLDRTAEELDVSMTELVRRLTGDAAPDVPVGVEVTDLDELRAALAPGIDVILLDNVDCVRHRRQHHRDRGGDPMPTELATCHFILA